MNTKLITLGIILGLLTTLDAAPSNNTKRVQNQKPQSARTTATRNNQKATTQRAPQQQANKPAPSQSTATRTPQPTPNPNLPAHLPSGPQKSDRSTWGVKSGFFGGIGIGAGMMLFSTPNMNNNRGGSNISTINTSGSAPAKESLLAVDYTAKLGFQYYFTMHQGIRMYASYTGGSAFPSGGGNSSLYYMNNSADFNVDYLVEIAQVKRMAFGVFGGVFVGYNMFYRNQSGDNSYQSNSSSGGGSSNTYTYKAGTVSQDGLMVGINFGVGYTFLRHHRFDITARVPLLSIYNVADIYRGNLYMTSGGGETDDIYYRYASINVSYSFIF